MSLEKHIELLSSVLEENLVKLYAACDVFVHPMKNEAWGMVILEAMAMGKPVVAVNSAGPKEIVVDGKTGYLARPSLEEFAEKISLLLTSPEKAKKMGEEGKKRVRRNFCWENSAQKMEEVFYKTRLEGDN